LTDRQILILNQFFDDIIICFDGDESGYKAALRAAENSIKELTTRKTNFFLIFTRWRRPLIVMLIKMVRQILLILLNKVRFQFINLYLIITNSQTSNDPSSMAIFEKKLRSSCCYN
jgi:DNA primase